MADDTTGRGGDGKPQFRSRLGPPPSRRGGKTEGPERFPRREDTSLAPVRRSSDPVSDEDHDDSPGFEEEHEERTQVGTNVSALREALLQRRLEREAAERAAKEAAAREAEEAAAAAAREAEEAAAREAEEAVAAAAREVEEASARETEEAAAREAKGRSLDVSATLAAAEQAALAAVERAGADRRQAAPPRRVGTLVFDAASIRQALDEAELDGDVDEAAPGESPAPAADRDEPAPDPLAAADPLRLTSDARVGSVEPEPADAEQPELAADPAQMPESPDEPLAASAPEEAPAQDLPAAPEALAPSEPPPRVAETEQLPAPSERPTVLVPQVRAAAEADELDEPDEPEQPAEPHRAPWEEAPEEPRSATLVLTGDALAAALSAPAPEGADDEEPPATQEPSPSAVVPEPLFDPDAEPGPVEIVAERTEIGLAPAELEPEPEWTAPEPSDRDTLMVRPERFWEELSAATEGDRTSVEPSPVEPEPAPAPAATLPPPKAPAQASAPPVRETGPGFGIGSVEIDDLDPESPSPPPGQGASLRGPSVADDDEDPHARRTSLDLGPEWSARARSMDTQILAMDPLETPDAPEPAWASNEVAAPDLDARSVLGPVGPAVARPSARRAEAAPDDSGELDVATITCQGATSFLRAMVVLGLLVLLGAFAVPTVTDGSIAAPWASVGDPQSLSFLCALLFVIELLVAAIPMPLAVRAGLLTAAGGTHLAFGALLMRDAALRFAFRAQPAVDTLFASGVAPTVLGLLAFVVLPAGLYARGRFTASLAARVTVGVGAALGLLLLLGWQALAPGLDGLPLLALVEQATGSASLQGDRIAALVALVGALALPLSALAFLGPRRTGLVSLWAFVWSFALGAALVVEAVHVAHLDQWREVLEPVRLAVFLAAGLLVTPVALGTLIGALAPGDQRR